MRFLLDQDVYGSTARFLGGLGHDVIPIAKLGLSRVSDSDLIRTARDQGRVLSPETETLAGWSFSGNWGPG